MSLNVKREWLISSQSDNIRDHYRFTSTTLGEGSYGFVKIATRLADKNKIAVKIIPKKKIKRLELLTREIAIMKTVDHPNIVKLFETYEDSRFIYLPMELCEGGELFDRIISIGHFSEQQAAHTFLIMLSAVAYLHSRDIVHRDLKPENFLYETKSDDSTLKLIDFGLSKMSAKHKELTTKTGTCYYVSPETLLGSYNEKCDEWSLGVILYMMLSGYPPFDGESDREVLESVRNSDLRFAEAVWDDISDQAKDLVSKLLDRNTEARITAQDAMSHPWITQNEECALHNTRLDLQQLRNYRNSNKFKKTVLNYMATQCSPGEVQELIQQFREIDTNHDGKLSISEIQEALNMADISKPELEELIQNIDTDGSGTIDLTEFLAAMLDQKIYLSQEKLWNAFKRFDINGSGKISASELREVLDQEHIISNPTIFNELIQEADMDGDGEIAYDEFVKMMEVASQETALAIRKSIGGEE